MLRRLFTAVAMVVLLAACSDRPDTPTPSQTGPPVVISTSAPTLAPTATTVPCPYGRFLSDPCFPTLPLPQGVVLLNEVPVGFVGTLDGIEFGEEAEIVCEAARTDPSALKDAYDGALFGGTDLDFEMQNAPPMRGAGSICEGQAFFINKSAALAGKPAQVTRKRGVGPVASPRIATRGPGQSGVYTATILGKAAVVTEKVVIMQDAIARGESSWGHSERKLPIP